MGKSWGSKEHQFWKKIFTFLTNQLPCHSFSVHTGGNATGGSDRPGTQPVERVNKTPTDLFQVTSPKASSPNESPLGEKGERHVVKRSDCQIKPS